MLPSVLPAYPQGVARLLWKVRQPQGWYINISRRLGRFASLVFGLSDLAWFAASSRSLRLFQFLASKPLHMVNLAYKIHFLGQIWGAADFWPWNDFFGWGLPCKVVLMANSWIPAENWEMLEYRVALYLYFNLNLTLNVAASYIWPWKLIFEARFTMLSGFQPIKLNTQREHELVANQAHPVPGPDPDQRKYSNFICQIVNSATMPVNLWRQHVSKKRGVTLYTEIMRHPVYFLY